MVLAATTKLSQQHARRATSQPKQVCASATSGTHQVTNTCLHAPPPHTHMRAPASLHYCLAQRDTNMSPSKKVRDVVGGGFKDSR